MLQKRNEVVFAQRLQNKNLAAGKKRSIDLKRRIFRGRSDEDDAAFFNVGQKSILLSFIEAMDFINEKDGPDAELSSLFGIGHDRFDLIDTTGDSRETNEIRFSFVSDD